MISPQLVLAPLYIDPCSVDFATIDLLPTTRECELIRKMMIGSNPHVWIRNTDTSIRLHKNIQDSVDESIYLWSEKFFCYFVFMAPLSLNPVSSLFLFHRISWTILSFIAISIRLYIEFGCIVMCTIYFDCLVTFSSTD